MQDASLELGYFHACPATVSALVSEHSVIVSERRIRVWNMFHPLSQRLPSVREHDNLESQWDLLWNVVDAFFFCRGGDNDRKDVNCETVVDEHVIRESVYLSGLVIAYNPSGCLNKESLLFNFCADFAHYLKGHYLLRWGDHSRLWSKP